MNIESQVKELEDAQIDLIHIDLVDNQFSPNLTFGPDFINQLRQITNIPFEIHYMVRSPSNLLNALDDDEIKNSHIFHLNTIETAQELRNLVLMKNDEFGLALSPNDEITDLTQFLDILDVVLMLCVHPGFYGSKFIDASYLRAKKVAQLISDHKIKFCVDGSMSLERALKMYDIGADIFVGGTSSIFNDQGSIAQNITAFNKALDF